MAKATHPLAREHSADPGHGVSFVSGCVCERKLSRRGQKRGHRRTRVHLDTAVGTADGAPTPSGACSQPSASWTRRIDAVGRRSDEPWLCSRAVPIAEVDGKRRAESSPLGEGGRSSPPGCLSPRGRKRRSKPARGGKVARTVADPRGSHGLVRGTREPETAVAESGWGSGGESPRPESVGVWQKPQGNSPASARAGVEERVLVVGRRLGRRDGVVFDEATAERWSGGCLRGSVERSGERGARDRGRQKLGRTLGAVDNTAVGRHGAEVP